MLLISHYVKPNTNDVIDQLNHFALLRGLEELFGVGKHLGFAGVPGLLTWSASVFNGP